MTATIPLTPERGSQRQMLHDLHWLVAFAMVDGSTDGEWRFAKRAATVWLVLMTAGFFACLGAFLNGQSWGLPAALLYGAMVFAYAYAGHLRLLAAIRARRIAPVSK